MSFLVLIFPITYCAPLALMNDGKSLRLVAAEKITHNLFAWALLYTLSLRAQQVCILIEKIRKDFGVARFRWC